METVPRGTPVATSRGRLVNFVNFPGTDCLWYNLKLFPNVNYLKSDIGKAMAPHSSSLAWKIPWTEEPGRLQSMGSLRVRHDWAISLSLFIFMHWRRKWQPTPVFFPGESQGRGAWWAAVSGVAQSRTRLTRLSSSIEPLNLELQVLLLISTAALRSKYWHHLGFLVASNSNQHWLI